jgi:hypothetical protein
MPARVQPPFRARIATLGLWAKSVVRFNAMRAHGQQSLRRLADRTGLSKSSGHRPLQTRERRDRPPEASLWDTEAGRAGLRRLSVATLLGGGLKRGVGAETLSEFCGRLRVDAPVGGSPSAWRTVMHPGERLIWESAAAWETDGIAPGARRPGIGAVDDLRHAQRALAHATPGALAAKRPGRPGPRRPGPGAGSGMGTRSHALAGGG